ncbi:winged helix-turn-helix transcriptional regulator [Saccharopolyspora rectivirgula]|jgi:DNA-binding HxlR family transcriptional regulator|uniref:HxlR family transcriptional regulator n=1 Tax=Saccharopolyspora rectivirgula TaxID=28042 RepID=A0A073B3D5_9PSEU|nr:helix-turn-helix domain-containing protein [Saccharopolyspora rectivirgula]KEI45767.1 HxlR family transcriptional regulator [Saccharopolyspora rectivirgula]MCC5697299.1 helix-turn-helix transcriptional regulator [Klebsiella pneumoniae]
MTADSSRKRVHRVDEHACRLSEVVERVSGKWSIGVLLAASRGPIRYTELERAVPGISRRMLTLTLRNLERDGLLARTVHPTVPPKVEYSPTSIGVELCEALTALTDWAQRHEKAIEMARRAYDAAESTEEQTG